VSRKSQRVLPPASRDQASGLTNERDKVRFVVDLIAGWGKEIYKRHQVLRSARGGTEVTFKMSEAVAEIETDKIR